jgi:hypothetical protein
MKKSAFFYALTLALLFTAAGAVRADSREQILSLGNELTQRAESLAQVSFDSFLGWRGEISEQEQAALFKSEAFAASCRLFVRLCGEKTGSFSSENVQTNLYNAFAFLARSFTELEGEMRGGSLADCRNVLADMEKAFSKWPAKDNLAYLHQKYVQADDQTIYLIERLQPGEYLSRPFVNLESFFRYNYLQKRAKDPWKYRVQIDASTLRKMPRGTPITVTFDGCLIMDMIARPNRPVFLIENGKKRPIPTPAVLERYGGWKRVFEVPREVIESYPEGQPLQ